MGRQFDKYGNRIPWWTNQTIKAFNQQKQCFIDQYNNYTLTQIHQNVYSSSSLLKANLIFRLMENKHRERILRIMVD